MWRTDLNSLCNHLLSYVPFASEVINEIIVGWRDLDYKQTVPFDIMSYKVTGKILP